MGDALALSCVAGISACVADTTSLGARYMPDTSTRRGAGRGSRVELGERVVDLEQEGARIGFEQDGPGTLERGPWVLA